MLALSLMASNGCLPSLVLYPEHAFSRPLQELPPLLPNSGARQVIARPSTVTMPKEEDDWFKSSSECTPYVERPLLRKLPLCVDLQDMPVQSVHWSSGSYEKWIKQKQLLRFLVHEDYLDPSVLPELMGLQVIPDVPHLQRVAISESDVIPDYVEKTSLYHPVMHYYQENDPDVFHDFPSSISTQSGEKLPFLGTMTDMKDLVAVLQEFSLRKDSAQWRKRKVLVPHFRWNDAIDEDLVYPSALKLQAVAAAPLKSPEKVRLKPAKKRKNKKSTRERNLYRSNSFHACESLLSLMMDNKRNGKSLMSSLKKSGPELPQLLTQMSATIAGTGLAVIFSLTYKVASGNSPFCPSDLFTSGFGIALFCVSWAVNKLRDTIIYISKNFTKLGFQDEEMTMRVDKNVNDVIIRAAASMVMLMLKFA